MTIDVAKPTVWAGTLLKHYRTSLVYKDLLTTEYEGILKGKGDIVRIISYGDPTIKTYTKNAGLGSVTAIDAPEILQDSALSVTADQYDYYNFGLDDIDAMEVAVNPMNEVMSRAGYQMSKTVDAYVSSVIAAGVATANVLTAATSVGDGATDNDLYKEIVLLGRKLDENDVPDVGRWVVLPPMGKSYLTLDPRFTSFGTVSNNGRLTNGLGQNLSINGMEVRVSNTVPLSGSTYTVLAGVKEAVAFVQTISDTILFKPHDGFNDAVRGHTVFGAKVLRPYALASVAITEAT